MRLKRQLRLRLVRVAHPPLRLRFIPSWAEVEPWVLRTAAANEFRVIPFLDASDLYQEAFLVFEKCRLRYPDVRQRSHFFALFRSAYTNTIHDMSRRRTRRQENPEAEVEHTLAPEHVPDEVSAVGKTIASLPRRERKFRHRAGRRETTEDYLRRVARDVSDEARVIFRNWLQHGCVGIPAQ